MNGTPTKSAVLEVHDINKGFPGVQALEGVSLAIHAGEVHVLMGENGAGKSTLMKILAGVYRADSGRIILDNTEVAPSSPLEAMALGITLVNQELGVATNLTVAENVFMGSEPSRWGILKRHEMVRPYARRFG